MSNYLAPSIRLRGTHDKREHRPILSLAAANAYIWGTMQRDAHHTASTHCAVWALLETPVAQK